MKWYEIAAGGLIAVVAVGVPLWLWFEYRARKNYRDYIRHRAAVRDQARDD